MNDEIIYLTLVDLPWPVETRELIARFRIERDSVTNGLIIKVNAIRHDFPVRDDLVRIPYSEATWTVKPLASGNGFTIFYTLQVDPGGSVPAWLINMAVAEGPFRSFKNLRTKVQEIALKK